MLFLIALLAMISTIIATHPTQISLNQHALYLTGSFDLDVTRVTQKDQIEINYEITSINNEIKIELQNTKIEIYQRPVLMATGDFTTNGAKKFDLNEYAFGKLNSTDPVQFALNQQLIKTPSELGLKNGDVIRSCISIQQNGYQWFEKACFDHKIVPSAVTPHNLHADPAPRPATPAPQVTFRSFCNGQSPPEPGFGDVLSYDHEELVFSELADPVAPHENNIQPGCNAPDRFHINAYSIVVPDNVKTTLTFRIFGHAEVRKLTGELNPNSMSCRVNTHYVTFTRSDKFEDETVRLLYPEGEVIYVADAVKELVNGGVLEIECDGVGLHYPIHYNDPSTQDRTTVPNIMYDTFIQVTISEAPSADRPWNTLPSFTTFFNQPALLNPVDLDIHSSSNYVKKSSNGDEWYDIAFFGSFYLTGNATKNDMIEICPLGVTMADSLSILITQQNFNTTAITNSTVPLTYPIPLLEESVKQNEAESANFIAGAKCFSINIFKIFPWRPKYTITPQLFRFSISTKVKDYQPQSALYTRFVSYTNSPTNPLYIYAATPLPSHKTPFSSIVELSPVKYDPEVAESHSTYSAKLTTVKFGQLLNDIDRVAFVLAGNHFFDGDIQCLFKYYDTSGDINEDYVSAHIDRTVQSARMVNFELENPIAKDKNESLTLDCKGLFVQSHSYAGFKGSSIFHIFGRDSTSHEFTLTTQSNFVVAEAEKAPQPTLPTEPANDDDDKKKKDKTKFLIIIGSVVGGIILLAIIAFVVVKIRSSKKTTVHSDPLLDGIDDIQYIH